MSEPQLGPVMSSSESVGNTVHYASVTLQGYQYHVGDSAYFDPDSFSFSVKLPPPAKKSKQEQADTKTVLNLFVFIVVFFSPSFLVFVLFFFLKFTVRYIGNLHWLSERCGFPAVAQLLCLYFLSISTRSSGLL